MFSGSSPASATGGQDTEAIPRFDLDSALAGETFLRTAANQPVLADGTRSSALETPRLEASTLAHQRHGGGCEELDLSFDAFAARVAPTTTRP